MNISPIFGCRASLNAKMYSMHLSTLLQLDFAMLTFNLVIPSIQMMFIQDQYKHSKKGHFYISYELIIQDKPSYQSLNTINIII
jgi:hypothetical protein